MSTVTISLPDELEVAMGCHSSVEIAREIRLMLAVKLFETERASSGQCAKIAGMSKREFLLELSKHAVPCVRWDAEELAAEAVSL